MTLEINPFFVADGYKFSHRRQYPKGTNCVYSTWVPRSSYIPGISAVVAFGFQAFIEEFLIDYFDRNFFEQPKDAVLGEYRRVIEGYFGQPAEVDHIAYVHELGYLPLLIKALPEGLLTPLRVPMLTIENTDPECFWLTNALETVISTQIWQCSTSATLAHEYRKLLKRWSVQTGSEPMTINFQAHDFSMRGMENWMAGAASGAAHLLSFNGTDTVPALLWAEEYYGAVITPALGTSIPATEHSVMCAYGQDELESFHHLINDVHPSGFLSVVSDTWDLWKILTSVLPTLKEEIMMRDGRLVIRPDSGNPADIICGDEREYGDGSSPQEKGVVQLLWDTFGGTINDKGYKVLDPHVGMIYGDAITLDRADEILRRLEQNGFAASNVVFGVGSYTYQYQTRDTFGFAMKATWVEIDGEEKSIFKAPVTDPGSKRSLTGRVVVLHSSDQPLKVIDGLTKAEQESYKGVDRLRTIFEDGKQGPRQTFAQIRERLDVQA